MQHSETWKTGAEGALIRRVLYPLWTKRNHPAYLRYAKSFEKSQFLPAEALRALQLGMLQEQIRHAYQHVPYYRRRMDEFSLRPEDIRSLEDFARFPALTKRDMQHYKQEMLADDIPENDRENNQTGGSTGSPLQFWVDKERFDSRRASTDRHNSWAGLRPGDWYAVLWGSTLDVGAKAVLPVTWRERWLERTLTLNTSVVKPEDMSEFVALLRRYRPRYLKAYAQAAATFAQYCADNHLQDIRFDAIITSAEVLTPENRALIEATFGGRVFNRYGCREVSVIASECEFHSGMHVNADALLVEIAPVPGGENGPGRVLVTDLLNRSMPLLRYEIGDLAEWAAGGPCPCGRSLPRLASVAGRTTDFLVLPNGAMISGPSLALLIGQTAEVRQAQFVQPEPGTIYLKVIPAAGYGPHTVDSLQRRVGDYLQGLATLVIQTVDEIPLEPSGKYRFVKREF